MKERSTHDHRVNNMDNMEQKKIFISEFTEGKRVVTFLNVANKTVLQKKDGSPFLRILFSDSSGEIQAVLWDNVQYVLENVKKNTIVKVQGLVHKYNQKPQLRIEKIRPAREEEYDLADFLRPAKSDPQEDLRQLSEFAETIEDGYLKSLVFYFLEDTSLMDRFIAAPGGKKMHHNYVGGLIEHTVAVCKICDYLCQLYADLDRDLLLSAAILHDLGKIEELSCSTSIEYTDKGRLLGHIVTTVVTLEKAMDSIEGFPEDTRMLLLHIIISHHGEYEYGSPKRPKILEAMALHHADNVDAKLNAMRIFAEEQADPDLPGWTQYWYPGDRYLYFRKRDDFEDPYQDLDVGQFTDDKQEL